MRQRSSAATRRKKCRYCGEWYTPHPQTYRRQKACSNRECQAQRGREAVRGWHVNNPTYDDGREEYLRRWRKNHPRDWKKYRADHPAGSERNRQQQGKRDRKRRHLAKRNDWERVHEEKLSRINRLGLLAKRNDSIGGVVRQTEEIRRYLGWSFVACKTKR